MGSLKKCQIQHSAVVWPELETLEWDILNPDRLINLEVQTLFNLEINKKRRLRITPDIHHSKVPSSAIANIYICER